MPEISRFYGIVIRMYDNDHPPPHFHAEYAGESIVVQIDTLAVVAEKLPPRATGLVMEWATQHQAELQDVWNQAHNLGTLGSDRTLAVIEHGNGVQAIKQSEVKLWSRS